MLVTKLIQITEYNMCHFVLSSLPSEDEVERERRERRERREKNLTEEEV